MNNTFSQALKRIKCDLLIAPILSLLNETDKPTAPLLTEINNIISSNEGYQYSQVSLPIILHSLFHVHDHDIFEQRLSAYENALNIKGLGISLIGQLSGEHLGLKDTKLSLLILSHFSFENNQFKARSLNPDVTKRFYELYLQAKDDKSTMAELYQFCFNVYLLSSDPELQAYCLTIIKKSWLQGFLCTNRMAIENTPFDVTDAYNINKNMVFLLNENSIDNHTINKNILRLLVHCKPAPKKKENPFKVFLRINNLGGYYDQDNGELLTKLHDTTEFFINANIEHLGELLSELSSQGISKGHIREAISVACSFQNKSPIDFIPYVCDNLKAIILSQVK